MYRRWHEENKPSRLIDIVLEWEKQRGWLAVGHKKNKDNRDGWRWERISEVKIVDGEKVKEWLFVFSMCNIGQQAY